MTTRRARAVQDKELEMALAASQQERTLDDSSHNSENEDHTGRHSSTRKAMASSKKRPRGRHSAVRRHRSIHDDDSSADDDDDFGDDDADSSSQSEASVKKTQPQRSKREKANDEDDRTDDVRIARKKRVHDENDGVVAPSGPSVPKKVKLEAVEPLPDAVVKMEGVDADQRPAESIVKKEPSALISSLLQAAPPAAAPPPKSNLARSRPPPQQHNKHSNKPPPSHIRVPTASVPNGASAAAPTAATHLDLVRSTSQVSQGSTESRVRLEKLRAQMQARKDVNNTATTAAAPATPPLPAGSHQGRQVLGHVAWYCSSHRTDARFDVAVSKQSSMSSSPSRKPSTSSSTSLDLHGSFVRNSWQHTAGLGEDEAARFDFFDNVRETLTLPANSPMFPEDFRGSPLSGSRVPPTRQHSLHWWGILDPALGHGKFAAAANDAPPLTQSRTLTPPPNRDHGRGSNRSGGPPPAPPPPRPSGGSDRSGPRSRDERRHGPDGSMDRNAAVGADMPRSRGGDMPPPRRDNSRHNDRTRR